MLIVFRAEDAADVMMFREVARELLAVIGKEDAEHGVVTVEQLPDALARLRQAVSRDRAHPQPVAPAPPGEDEDDDRPKVSLTQRALPLVALMEHAQREQVPVTWGPQGSAW